MTGVRGFRGWEMGARSLEFNIVIPLLFLVMLSISTGCTIDTSCRKVLKISRYTGEKVNIDGAIDEPIWQRIRPVVDFTFPWKERDAPLTEFRSFVTDQDFYFSFRITDSNLTVLETLTKPEDVTREDRVEIFFSRDPELKNYYCVEIDPKGRVVDYRGSFYRKFDNSWRCAGLKTKGRITNEGYIVEAKIPLNTFHQLGILLDEPEKGPHLFGLYRAEFSKTGTEEPIQEWISWIDPKTPTPDFHVPASFGCFEIGS